MHNKPALRGIGFSDQVTVPGRLSICGRYLATAFLSLVLVVWDVVAVPLSLLIKLSPP